MIDDNLFEFLISEAEHHVEGWDFSYLNDRIIDAPLTWSYTSKIIPIVRQSNFLLDMGTGGGEFLSSLVPLPKYTCATEGYEPNVPIARKRLEPLGVEVFPCLDDNNLPFNNEEFDLIINRHESYSPEEVFRILKHGGRFITQQVGEKNDAQLRFFLTGKEELEDNSEWNLNFAKQQLEEFDFQIQEDYEDFVLTRIFDVGAIVFYLKVVPWELPNFSVKDYYKKLVDIHKQITELGYVDLKNNSHRFFIKAFKK